MADAGACNPFHGLHLRLQAPATWVGAKLQGVIKRAEQSVEKWGCLLQSGIRDNLLSSIWSTSGMQGMHLLDSALEVETGQLERQLVVWRRNSFWVDETPALEVMVRKGTLCKFDSCFQLGIPPDAVYNILVDPNNKRVFKNTQEVNYRKVLEDDSNRQLVELEQLASWRFLWLSGILSACVFVDQDTSVHMVKYWLAKTGFMKRFEGS